MDTPPNATNGEGLAKPDRLSSWKEIAQYLGTTPRNALRWRDLGLPVHNHPVSKNVWALKSELDAWREQRVSGSSIEPPPSRRWLVGGIGLAAGLVSGFGIALRYHNPHDNSSETPEISGEPRIVRRIASSKPATSAIWTADGQHVFACSFKEPTIQKIDTQHWTISASLRMQAQPQFIEAPPRAPRSIYILDHNGNVHSLDPVANIVYLFHSFEHPAYSLTASPDGKFLYLTQRERGLIRVAVPTQIETVLAKRGHVYLARTDRTGEFLLVSYLFGGPHGRTGHDTIEVVRADTGASVKQFTELPSSGGGGWLHRHSNQWWVGLGDACLRPEYDHSGCISELSTPVVIIDATTFAIGPMFNPPGVLSGAIQFSPCGSVAYLPGPKSLMVVDTATKQLRARLPLALCGHIAFRDDRDVAVAPQGLGEIAVVQWRIPVRLSLGESGNYLLIQSSPDLDLRQIDPSTIRINGQFASSDKHSPIELDDSALGDSGLQLRIPLDRFRVELRRPFQLHALTYGGLVLRGQVNG